MALVLSLIIFTVATHYEEILSFKLFGNQKLKMIAENASDI